MWGKREFVDSSSSSESISTRPSVPGVMPDYLNTSNEPKHIPKPPSIRPISANSRILSIQRAKLLKRGNQSIRVETSPFFKNNMNTMPWIPDRKPESNVQRLNESQMTTKIDDFNEIEEIKIDERISAKEKTTVKKFLRPDSPERIDPSIVKPNRNEDEITPEPRYQRVMMQSNKVRERPASHACQRRSTRDFKAITTVSIKKGSSTILTMNPDFKTSVFNPVPLGSSLLLSLSKLKDDLNHSAIQYNIKIVSTGLLLFSCKRRKSGNIVFSLSEKDFSRHSDSFIGKLAVKKGKNVFKFYDNGKKIAPFSEVRKQYGYLEKEKNGFIVLIPKVENNCIVDLQPELVECGFGPSTVEKFFQKNFKPSGFLCSNKNFILTDDKSIGDYVKMEKIRKSTYKIVVGPPFSAFQAVCVALSRF